MSAEKDDATEMESFWPANGKDETERKSKMSIVSGGKEHELLQIGDVNVSSYDPFKERNNPHPTTDAETFTHLLKAALGSGILSMPYAFNCAGLSVGFVATLVTAFVCTYCSYLLVKCAQSLYYRSRRCHMSYAEVAEVSFQHGPKFLRGCGSIARISVMTALFVTYFGAISCYTVIAGENFKHVIEYYAGVEYNIRIYILFTLPPLLVLCFIPNLKALAPFSLIANVLIITGLGITLYYLVFDFISPRDIRQVPKSIMDLPMTFSITVFAMEAIGLMLPLENNMKSPKHFLGFYGVLSSGMSVVSMIYILIGALGYLKYGENTKANITANLPVNEIGPQIAKICIGISVLLTYVLQYFVCLEIFWSAVKHKFVKREKMFNGLTRMSLVGFSVFLAVVVPQIGPFVSLIGALCFSFLGILFPIVIEIVTYSEKVSWQKLVLRNSFVILFGVMALCVGTYTSMQEIIGIYALKPEMINFNASSSAVEH